MTLRMPPLYALRAFEVAARFGSFTQAAESLCITQSAVSRHVKTLEENLGCQLFERRGSRLALTDTGRLLAQELKVGFRTLENACIAVNRQQDALRLKAPSTLTMRWLLGALEDFQLTHPQNRVQLTSAWMDLDAVDFHNEPFDCAILLGHGGFPADWNRVKLFDEWLVPVCSPEVLGDTRWTATQLASAELIHPSRDCRDWRRWLQRVGLIDAVAWQQGKLFDTLELGISAAAQGHGVSIGDLALVAAELHKGSLMLPFDTAVRSGDSYYLVWPAAGETPITLTHMKNYLLEHLPDIGSRGVSLLD
ncbi:LysR substrate-binding domain-containing protein [Stutzerimonas xanthomarina]|uniref:Transcriptional regulator, LysR family n=2 Tax=Stutzerimonas xanthomarina TaxID=271420 RepID=A0A1M5KUJ0_9GAMM|nr:LysR substrate-binding domain-containing protein [Stutzerimonas xanthomarina]MCP9337313.1 LysR substrate-binding domain-containing protein [Stutzerimonas xanthomarina]SEI08393.1 DNA-binding transcriptional regulator, LysR family [Stutzerimonas xanthomarina]SHG56438.1 transcriptional regulator, LysR family [Stutzerimonas xanthomarina DSM 18231]